MSIYVESTFVSVSSNVVRGVVCADLNDARNLRKIIEDAISRNLDIEVSFNGVKVVTTAFLSVAIAWLYLDYPEYVINERLRITGLDEDCEGMLQYAIDGALDEKAEL